jgi:hypothetical protein
MNDVTSDQQSDRRAVLAYEAAPLEPPTPRPVWVYVLAGAYVLCLAGLLLLPAGIALFTDTEKGGVIAAAAYVCLLLLCGFSLVLAPVRARRRRPITRRSIWFPILGSALLFALLFLGFSMALAEWLKLELSGWTFALSTGGVWLAWAVVFGLLSLSADPTTLAGWSHRFILGGSALELLVAVPAHVVVRRRSDCCAGLATGTGICIGVTVMLVAFGPSVFILYYKRWKQLRRKEPQMNTDERG